MSEKPSESKNNAPTNVDGWANVLTGIGTSRDKRTLNAINRSVQLSEEELDDLYHDDDVTARICTLVPSEMLREWIEIQGDPEGKILKALDALDAKSALFKANVWARLYGEAFVLLGANDGQPLDQPLDVARVRSVDFMTVLHRHEIAIVQRYGDVMKASFGEPELYEVRSAFVNLSKETTNFGARIHESRLLKFEGTLTGRRRKLDNEGFAESVVQRTYDVIRDFNGAFSGASAILEDFSQAVFKIKNLANMLAADQDNLVIKRLKLLDMSRSIARAAILDADGEDFDRKATPISGMPDLLDRIASRLSAATDIPLTLLMGVSPGGMNATGASDHRFFYNQIKNKQETLLRPQLSYLIQILAQSLGVQGDDDQELGFSFRPLWTPSESETADTRLKVAQQDKLYFDMGVLDAAEISVSRFGGDKYSMETTIDQQQPAPVDDVEDDEQESETESAAKEANAAEIADLVARVQSNAIPRDSALAILKTVYGFDVDTADALLGSAGRTNQAPALETSTTLPIPGEAASRGSPSPALTETE